MRNQSENRSKDDYLKNKILRGMASSPSFQAFQLNLQGSIKTRFGHAALTSLLHKFLQAGVSLWYAPRHLEAVHLYWKSFPQFNIAHL